MKLFFSCILLLRISGIFSHLSRKLRGEQRRTQGYCETLNSLSPSDNSNCWETNEIGGCDNQNCQQAVCECDSYCCNKHWDLSCSGYFTSSETWLKDNFFFNGCSASILCCEQEDTTVALPAIYNQDIPVAEECICDVPPPDIMPSPVLPNEPIIIECQEEGWYAPSDSTCWKYNDQPDNSPSSTVGDQKGCDHGLCEQSVCACDSYCCEISWDLSCRGIPVDEGELENNYFVGGCSAAILCCEPDDAPKPIIIPPEAVEPPVIMPIEPIEPPVIMPIVPIATDCESENWQAPSNSNCWLYNDQPDNSPTSTIGDQRGCDYQLCEEVVCACDSYCCDVSWDLSCRGIPIDQNSPEDNYFVGGCSAAILCCEPADAPKPIIEAPEAVLPPADCECAPQPILPPLVEEIVPPPIDIVPEPAIDCKSGNWQAPSDSSCWLYNEQTDNSSTSTIGDQKGCDHELCEQAVCSCDSYCCDVSWDLSCRGIPISEGEPEDNFFHGGCSASILCCEPVDAPKPIPPEAVLPPTDPEPPLIIVPEPVPEPIPEPAPIPQPVPEPVIPEPVPDPIPEPIPQPIPEPPVIISIPDPEPQRPIVILPPPEAVYPEGKSKSGGGGKKGTVIIINPESDYPQGKSKSGGGGKKSGGMEGQSNGGKTGGAEGQSNGGKTGGGKTGGASAAASDGYYGKKGYSRGNYYTLLSYLRGNNTDSSP